LGPQVNNAKDQTGSQKGERKTKPNNLNYLVHDCDQDWIHIWKSSLGRTFHIFLHKEGERRKECSYQANKATEEQEKNIVGSFSIKQAAFQFFRVDIEKIKIQKESKSKSSSKKEAA